jgi:hypothetical protein
MNKDAETILLFLMSETCDCSYFPSYKCKKCSDNDAAINAAKRLTYQPYIDFSTKTRRDGMWVLQLVDLSHFYLRPGERISVNQKEFVIQKINCVLEREMVRQIEIIGDFV